jgi:hypothetical protein
MTDVNTDLLDLLTELEEAGMTDIATDGKHIFYCGSRPLSMRLRLQIRKHRELLFTHARKVPTPNILKLLLEYF